jgi:hypothetical protein
MMENEIVFNWNVQFLFKNNLDLTILSYSKKDFHKSLIFNICEF